MQRMFEVNKLPDAGLEASAVFHAQHLAKARAMLDGEGIAALAIVLPPAGYDHDDWRTALARDLARAHTPCRVNVVSGPRGNVRDAIVAYLGGAPGVTGQYLKAHD